MIREFDIRRRGDAILVGIAVEHAVLDFETTEGTLRECLVFLGKAHCGLIDMRVGSFGDFPVRLNVHHDDSLSICLDGPYFEPTRSQCAILELSKEDLRQVINAVLAGA
jgi:hypothetical protein